MLFIHISGNQKEISLWVIFYAARVAPRDLFWHYLSALSRPWLSAALLLSISGPVSNSVQITLAEPLSPPAPPSDAQSLIYKVVSSSDPSLSGRRGTEEQRMKTLVANWFGIRLCELYFFSVSAHNFDVASLCPPYVPIAQGTLKLKRNIYTDDFIFNT